MTAKTETAALNRYALLTLLMGASVLLLPAALGQIVPYVDPEALRAAGRLANDVLTAAVFLVMSAWGWKYLRLRRRRAIAEAVAIAVSAQRAASVDAIHDLMQSRGQPRCCGSDIGGYGPPECCGRPRHMIDGDDAIEAVLSRKAI